jgi:hypothetical protein
MGDKRDTLVERVQQTFRQLSVASTALNTISDKLGESIANLDGGLKKLNLGISSWVHFSEGSSEDGFYYSFDDVGYAKIGGKWGIAIRCVSGTQSESEDNVEQWAFNDAPRNLRVKAVVKIPDLFEKLLKDAEEITKKVASQIEEVDILTRAITGAMEQSQVEAKHAKSNR